MNEKPVVKTECWNLVVVTEGYTSVWLAKETIRNQARMNHWSIREMGCGNMIYDPVIVDGLKYEPLILDESTIPKRARGRIDLILKSGIRPQGILIGYEIETETKPKTQPLPWVVPESPQRSDSEPKPATKPLDIPKILRDVDWYTVVEAIATVTLFILKVYGFILLAGLAFLGFGLAACGSDPSIVFVVGEEGEEPEWIELYRYYH